MQHCWGSRNWKDKRNRVTSSRYKNRIAYAMNHKTRSNCSKYMRIRFNCFLNDFKIRSKNHEWIKRMVRKTYHILETSLYFSFKLIWESRRGSFLRLTSRLRASPALSLNISGIPEIKRFSISRSTEQENLNFWTKAQITFHSTQNSHQTTWTSSTIVQMFYQNHTWKSISHPYVFFFSIHKRHSVSVSDTDHL